MVWSATDEPKSPVEGKACERRDAFEVGCSDVTSESFAIFINHLPVHGELST